MKKTLFLASAILLCWLGLVSYDRLTDGFSLGQIRSTLDPCPQFDIELDLKKKEQLVKLLDQKFHYLGKGCEFYAFESEDGLYVIKFFKHKHLRSLAWLRSIWMPKRWRSICDELIAKRRARVERLLASCYLAYEKMQEETALLFLHLNRVAALETTVTIQDKLGRTYRLVIDEYEFCIQRKGQLALQLFTQLPPEEISDKVEQLKQLVLKRCNKGICDGDRAFIQNVAFGEQGPFFTDIGQFYESSSISQEAQSQEDVKRRLANFESWLYDHCPEQFDYLKTQRTEH